MIVQYKKVIQNQYQMLLYQILLLYNA